MHLPSWLYLVAVMILALVFWGTIKGDVPLFLSSSAVANTLIAIVDQENAQTIADLGAGIGSVVLPLTKHRAATIDAWEQAPLPWFICSWRCRNQPTITVKRANFWHSDLSHYDLVFAFLSPAVMVALGKKIKQEMKTGTLFISSSFPIPDWEPESIIYPEDRRQTMLFCYRI